MPQITSPPRQDEIGLNQVAISWKAWHEEKDSGLGPVQAYKVYRRYADDGAVWQNVGYVDIADAIGDTFLFNLTCLQPNTEMEISIAAIHLCSGEEGELHGASFNGYNKW